MEKERSIGKIGNRAAMSCETTLEVRRRERLARDKMSEEVIAKNFPTFI